MKYLLLNSIYFSNYESHAVCNCVFRSPRDHKPGDGVMNRSTVSLCFSNVGSFDFRGIPRKSTTINFAWRALFGPRYSKGIRIFFCIKISCLKSRIPPKKKIEVTGSSHKLFAHFRGKWGCQITPPPSPPLVYQRNE